MSDIANHLGISKRTLYENFPNKEILLEECVRLSILDTDAEINDLINTSENAIDALMKVYSKNLEEAQNINKTAIYDIRKYHPRIYQMIDEKQKEGVEFFIPLFEKGVKQGLIREDINFEVLVWLLKAQCKMLLENDYVPVEKYGIHEFWGAIILNFTRGIATAEGNKFIDQVFSKIK